MAKQMSFLPSKTRSYCERHGDIFSLLFKKKQKIKMFNYFVII